MAAWIVGLLLAAAAPALRAEPAWTGHVVDSNVDWSSVALSADGTHLAVARAYGDLYLSGDSGASWSSTPSSEMVAMSGNGDVLASWSASGAAALRVSTDGGTTWVERTPSTGVFSWRRVVLSTTGSCLVATGPDGLYTSSDFGATWTKRERVGGGARVSSWGPVGMSADGARIVALDYSDPQHVYVSTDSGATWTARQPVASPADYWMAMDVAISGDGTSLAVAAYDEPDAGWGDYVYTSTNLGQTWTRREPAGADEPRMWGLGTLTMDSDGSCLAIGSVEDWNGEEIAIRTSADGGASWSSSAPVMMWVGLAMSSDGSHLAAAALLGPVVGSTDGGTTWPEFTNMGAGAAISTYAMAADADASQLALFTYDGSAYISADSGATWTQLSPGGEDWFGADTTPDGQFIVAASSWGDLVVSTDGGDSWTSRVPTEYDVWWWLDVACSHDGSVLIGGAYNDYVYTSTDSGLQWTKREPAGAGVKGNWADVAVSGDGQKMVVCGWGFTYTSTDGGATWTLREPAGAGGADGWRALAMSSDGVHVVIGVSSGENDDSVYTSDDSGATWTRREPTGADARTDWEAVAISDSGAYLLAADEDGQLYSSCDGGETWAPRHPGTAGATNVAEYVAMSTDGLHLAVVGPTLIYTATQSGIVPDAFSFTDRTGVEPGATVDSDTVTIAGLAARAPAPISVWNGQYRIGTGAWTAAAGTIGNGQMVTLRQTTSTSYETETQTVLFVGDQGDAWSTTTRGAVDTTPDPFSFTDQTSVAASTQVTSSTITVAGISSAAPVTVTGGEYRIGTGAWTSTAGTVTNGQTVTLRQTSSANSLTTTNTVLSIGGVSDTWSVTTRAEPQPDFTVTSIVVAPAPVPTGSKFTASVTVANNGTLAGKGGTLTVYIDQATAVAVGTAGSKSVQVPKLNPGQTKVIKFAALTAPAAVGTHQFRAFVDATNATAELNEGNNQLAVAYTVDAPDFTITGITFVPADPTAGRAFTACITVLNNSPIAGNGGTLDVWLNQPVEQVAGATTKGDKSVAVGVLKGNAQKVIKVGGLKPGPAGPDYTLRALVDSRAKAVERSETNNQATRTYRSQ